LQRHFVTSSADAVLTKFSLDLVDTQQVTSQNAEKTINTKHAGQQGLNVRSDGKIFATAGWDGRIRVYSCKTMKELAVLKWHKNGCYATNFAEIITENQKHRQDEDVHSERTEIATRMSALDHIKQEREDKARSTHWLAAGGKDAKITLWEVY
jgi:ASTRA-associated protein 1